MFLFSYFPHEGGSCASQKEVHLSRSMRGIIRSESRQNIYIYTCIYIHIYLCINQNGAHRQSSGTAIGESTFKGCESLVSITIPESVMAIGAEAFQDCQSLAIITIPVSVAVFQDNVFSGCSSLASITVTKPVTAIGDEPLIETWKRNMRGAARYIFLFACSVWAQQGLERHAIADLQTKQPISTKDAS